MMREHTAEQRCACSPKREKKEQKQRQVVNAASEQLSHCDRCCRPPPPCCCTASAAPLWRTPLLLLFSGRRPCKRTSEKSDDKGSVNTHRLSQLNGWFIFIYYYLFIFSYHWRSTSPPWWAMADFTLLANCTASSPSCHFIKKVRENKVLLCVNCCSLVFLTTHLLVHCRQVPDVADKGPAGHHPQQVVDHAVLGAIPKCISKLWVVLAGSPDINR